MIQNDPHHQYENLLSRVYHSGVQKSDRTGVGTRSIFGHQMRFDLAKGFPLVTTKRVFWRAVVAELLWMLSGSTNVRDLQAQGVTIWDEWADENGELGPVYGAQWRSWLVESEEGSYIIDQIQDVIDLLKRDPDSRRLVVSAWNPADLPDMALAPCHCLFQFNTRPMTLEERWKSASHPGNWGTFNKMPEKQCLRLLDNAGAPTRFLDLQLYQRSGDVFLGVPFNIASYALLAHLMAQVVGMAPGEFVHSFGNVHLYNNHVDQAKLQLSREIWARPQLRLNPNITDLFAFTADDIELLNYRSHDAIAAAVAV